MRLKYWFSALAVSTALSVTAMADDRDKHHRERDKNRHERREDERERNKEWREYLKDRKKSYKE